MNDVDNNKLSWESVDVKCTYDRFWKQKSPHLPFLFLKHSTYLIKFGWSTCSTRALNSPIIRIEFGVNGNPLEPQTMSAQVLESNDKQARLTEDKSILISLTR